MTDWDVTIVGAGPSGCACALRLLRAGLRVLVLDAGRKRPHLGESLPPRGMRRLRDLGFGDFIDSAHRSSMGIESTWDGHEGEHNFLFSPYGFGAHLDTGEFCRGMLAAVQDNNGVVKRSSMVKNLWGPPWTVGFTDKTRNAVANTTWVVDATGRLGLTYRRLERGQRRLDNLVAYVRDTTLGDGRQVTSVESTPSGWWFSAPASKDLMIAGYFTDADLHIGSPQLVWRYALESAPKTTERINAPISDVKVFSAATIRPPDCLPSNYLPVGDAAMSFDPLSGSGVTMAIETGVNAAQAIMDNDSNTYRVSLHRSFSRYLAGRNQVYSWETRHSHHPFWQRRRSLGDT